MDRDGSGEPDRETGKGWKTSGKESETVKDLPGQDAAVGCRDTQLEEKALFTSRPPSEAGKVSPQQHGKISKTRGL